MLYGLVDPVGEATYSSNGHNKRNCGKTLKPCRVSKLKMVFILHRAEKELAHHAENIDCSDHDGSCTGYHKAAMEHIRMLERADEDRHLRNEARQAA